MKVVVSTVKALLLTLKLLEWDYTLVSEDVIVRNVNFLLTRQENGAATGTQLGCILLLRP